MGVRFVIGRAGSGKTRHCFDAIVEQMRAAPLGAAIYWILPKQATFSAERELTVRSGLDGFCRARVLSFDLLGEEVLAACGGAEMQHVSAVGRQMLLGFLLRRHQDDLKYFRSVARQPGLAARLDTTFAEFERCGKDADALAALLQELGSGDDIERRVLREKLADFHLLFRAYHEAIGQERVDPHRRLEQVIECIADYRLLRGASVYIDEFREFTERERRMILALATICSSVDITLPLDPGSPTFANLHHLPDELGLFHLTESTYRQLALGFAEAGVTTERPVVLNSTLRFEQPALKAIEKSLFSRSAVPENATEGIELVEAPDRRGEVDAVARRIRELLRQGLRLRDIVVLMRDVEEYEQLISASFREHGIPYFVDRRRLASHHPLLQFVRSLLVLARQNWPGDALMSVLKSGLARLELNDAEELENYVLLHRIKGSAWSDRAPWDYARKTGRDDDEMPESARIDAARMDALRRRLIDPMLPFVRAFADEKPKKIREIVVELFKLLGEFDVRTTLGRWIERATEANDVEQAGEHEQVWSEMVKLFDQMVELIGDEPVMLADFSEILEAGLEQFDLALAPPRVDQVLVGQVDRTRISRIDTAIVLGLSEGQFPKIAREDSVLSDSERRSLRTMHLEIDPDSERRLLDENLLGYVAFTRGSKRLIVARPVSQDQKPVGPSAFWMRLRRMFPALPVVHEKREADAGADAIGTQRQLVTALMRWARSEDASADAQQPWASLYQWLRGHDCCDDPLDVLRFNAWKALSYDNAAKLSPQVAAKLVGQKLHASVTRIEAFATCPFKHFARYHLGLSEREDAELTAMDMGNVYHRILEGVVGHALQSRKDWCQAEKCATAELIGKLAEQAGKELRGELMLSTARNKYLLSRIEKNLRQVCATQQRVLSRGGFRPAFAELEFGTGEASKLPPLLLRTPKGREILLRGKIDRVDLLRDGSAAAVVDYKMSDRRLALHEVYHGLSLQLLTYLLVLEASGQTLAGKKLTPVAAFYSRLLRSLESIDHPDDAPDVNDPAFDLRVKPRGIFDSEYLSQLDADLQSGASEVVAAFINKEGAFGRIDSSDVAAPNEFAAILKYVRGKITELADQMIDGLIEARPYRMGRQTPCGVCEFRSVCRFDPAINSYLNLMPMKRSEVLARVTEERHGG